MIHYTPLDQYILQLDVTLSSEEQDEILQRILFKGRTLIYIHFGNLSLSPSMFLGKKAFFKGFTQDKTDKYFFKSPLLSFNIKKDGYTKVKDLAKYNLTLTDFGAELAGINFTVNTPKTLNK